MTFFQPGQQAYCQAVGTSSTSNNVIFQRDPNPFDVEYPIGKFWQNQASGTLYILNSFTSSGATLQAVWLLVSVENELVSLTGSNSPLTPVYPTSATGTPPDNIQLTNLDGSMTITSDPANNRVLFTAVSSGALTWTNESSSFVSTVNSGFFIISALTATLPSSPTIGQTIYFIVDTVGTFIIQASGGLTIRIANSISSANGTATNTQQGDSITLVYSDNTSSWIANSVDGNWILA